MYGSLLGDIFLARSKNALDRQESVCLVYQVRIPSTRLLWEGPTEMRTVSAALCFALACGGSASAAEKVAPHHPTSPPVVAEDEPSNRMENHGVCVPLEKFKTAFAPKTQFATASIGMFHALEGVYVGNPNTPEGLPPGDGALIITPPAQHGHPVAGSFVTWLRGDKEVCASPKQILMVPQGALAILEGIETGKGETITPDDSKDELKL